MLGGLPYVMLLRTYYRIYRAGNGLSLMSSRVKLTWITQIGLSGDWRSYVVVN